MSTESNIFLRQTMWTTIITPQLCWFDWKQNVFIIKGFLLYRYWYLRTIFLVWKAVSWFVLNERYPIRIMKRFFHTWKNRFVQSVRAYVYIAVNSFTAGKLSGEIFFKLLAVSCVWKSILDLNSTRWAISHVYKDLQFYKKPKIYFWKRNMQAKGTAVIPKQTTR